MTSEWVPDASAVAAFRRSPEEFRLRYRQHLARGGWVEAPDAGSAFHTALDGWFGPEGGDIEAAVAALRAAWGGPDDGLTPQRRPLALMERVLRAYAERWPRAADPFTVEATEANFRVRIERAGVAFDWCGRKDRVVAFEGGVRAVMDTKTTSGWFHTAKTEGFFSRYELAEAMLGYVASEVASGRPCATYYIDAVHVDEVKDGKGGNIVPERDFRRWRAPGVVQPWRLDRWARDVAYTLDAVRALDESRGPDEPWPVYVNWAFGQPDEFWRIVTAAPELAAAEALGFERRPWRPWEAGK